MGSWRELKVGQTEKQTFKCKQLYGDNNYQHTEYCAPLTSFDWNQQDLKMIGTSSIDTTCTIWDLERESVQTQLIAHDKAVYDICFAQDVSMFASAGEDGSVRHFDLRDLEHSTIIYESLD